jgi:hypothetical protein
MDPSANAVAFSRRDVLYATGAAALSVVGGVIGSFDGGCTYPA